MAAQRFEGHNLEEALENASRALGVPTYQIDHHVVVEKRGFLGGLKRIVIEAEADPDRQPPLPPSPRPDRPPRPEPGRSPRARDDRSPRHDRGPRRRERDGNRETGAGRGGRDRRPSAPSADGWIDELPPESIPDQEERSPEAARVAAWFEELFELADLDLEMRTVESDERIDVRLYGRDGVRLLERGGELLDSVQALANKALVGREPEKSLELDCRGFKQRRSSELEGRARAAAAAVRADGREQLLPAMSPVERRIVHLALAEDREVTTESRGEGFFKRVAIVLRREGDEADAVEPEP
ncbi:MAG TPA: R3H domain-containing nucleic acid-binding protein [Thermoanaerobaculia bacterium]|nr:R3H domain-containing nucleic acid-binding protein [Thermoanaerobaculia bacterium]